MFVGWGTTGRDHFGTVETTFYEYRLYRGKPTPREQPRLRRNTAGLLEGNMLHPLPSYTPYDFVTNGRPAGNVSNR